MNDAKEIPVIALDANALISIGRADPLLWRLLEAAKNGKVRLLIPYVAFKEMVRRRALKHVETRSRDRMKAPEDLPNLAAKMDDIAWEWGQTFESCGVEILPIDPSHLEEARHREREMIPPFKDRGNKKQDNDFRDALIFCAVRTAIERHATLVFACQDEYLRSTVVDELNIEARKHVRELLVEILGNDGDVSSDPFNVPSRGGRPYPEHFKEKYSHPEFELILPERSHNRLDLETKLNEVAQDFKDQVCCVLAIARLFQPAYVNDTFAALKSPPFSYSDHACSAALDSLLNDGTINIIGDAIIVRDEDFAEQAIGRLGDRVIDLMRAFND